MMRVTTLFLVFFLVGCAGQFAVQEMDTRFSENKNSVYVSKNNRISIKSVAGGIHIDDKGVYINPFVEKDTKTKQVVRLGLAIMNVTDVNTMVGGVNRLGVIQEIVFRFRDGKLVTLSVTQQQNQSSGVPYYNAVGGYASMGMVESGMATISIADYEKIISADSLSCKISGSQGLVVYEEKDISDSFFLNLKQFYQQYVKQ
jgi:hypothetical protein